LDFTDSGSSDTDFGSSRQGMFTSMKGWANGSSTDRATTDYTNEENRLTSDDGWGWLDRFFHNTWAPLIYKFRHIIFFGVTGIVIFCAVSAFMFLVPADKPPSFFPESHNLGMLEIVNADYVASSSVSEDVFCAISPKF